MIIQTTKVFALLRDAVAKGYTTISEQGSARSSKTYNTLIWLIDYALRNPNTRISIVRATLPAIRGSVLVDFLEILSRFGVYEESAFNKSQLTYELSNGSWFEFFSTDSEQKLRGRKRDILFVNEANEISFLEWQQLKMRTSGVAILDYNPSFSEEHWINDVNADYRTFHFTTTYRDNPFLEESIIREIESLREKNPALWNVYGLGKRASIEGRVFPRFDLVEDIPASARRSWIGMDFGYTNDPTAIVRVALDGKALYLDEICYRTRMGTGDLISVLKDASSAGRKIIAESADPRLIDEIHMSGLNIHPVKKFPGSVQAGLSTMSEYSIFVTKRSTNIIKELRNYIYAKDKEGRFLNTPVDAFNHAIDAARYVVLSEILGGKKGKGVRKPVFEFDSQF